MAQTIIDKAKNKVNKLASLKSRYFINLKNLRKNTVQN